MRPACSTLDRVVVRPTATIEKVESLFELEDGPVAARIDTLPGMVAVHGLEQFVQ
jgi:hypothetical protein